MYLYRSRQLEDRRAAQQAYNNSLKDVSSWLIPVERRFNGFRPVAKELDDIKEQYEELKVWKRYMCKKRDAWDAHINCWVSIMVKFSVEAFLLAIAIIIKVCQIHDKKLVLIEKKKLVSWLQISYFCVYLVYHAWKTSNLWFPCFAVNYKWEFFSKQQSYAYRLRRYPHFVAHPITFQWESFQCSITSCHYVLKLFT